MKVKESPVVEDWSEINATTGVVPSELGQVGQEVMVSPSSFFQAPGRSSTQLMVDP